MNIARKLAILALVLVGASQALAKPPIFILPGILDSNLLVDYDQAADPSKACTQPKLTGVKMWPPAMDNLNQFITTFNPVLPNPTCWYYLMQLANTTQNGSFVSHACTNVSASLTLSGSLILPPLVTVLRNATGYNLSQISVLAYDWRLDVNSLEKAGEVKKLASRIISISQRSKEQAILIGYSQGNLVALKLLQNPAVRAAVKGYMALAPPFGGTIGVIRMLTSGSTIGTVDPVLLNNKNLQLPPIAPFTQQQLLWNSSQGMASLAMLAPSLAAFPNDPVVVTANSTQYKVSQIPALLRAIGQVQLGDAHAQLQQVPVTGPLENITTYCIYGSGVKTTKALLYKKAFEAGVIAEEPMDAASTTGDRVISLASLSLCDKLTTTDKVMRLPAPVDHYNIFAHPSGRAAIAKALKELIAM